jgi:hypothetical protein
MNDQLVFLLLILLLIFIYHIVLVLDILFPGSWRLLDDVGSNQVGNVFVGR